MDLPDKFSATTTIVGECLNERYGTILRSNWSIRPKLNKKSFLCMFQGNSTSPLHTNPFPCHRPDNFSFLPRFQLHRYAFSTIGLTKTGSHSFVQVSSPCYLGFWRGIYSAKTFCLRGLCVRSWILEFFCVWGFFGEL